MNDSQVCLTTHVELANTNSLYRDWKKMDTKNYSFGQDNKYVCQNTKMCHVLKFRLLYYDAAENNRFKLKISTCVFDLFIHNVCSYFSAWEASMIQRVLLMYLGITLEPVFRKIKSTQ